MSCCRECKFAKVYSGYCECRKYAPAPGGVEGAYAYWPVVDSDDCCGEHERKPVAEGALVAAHDIQVGSLCRIEAGMVRKVEA